jgi:hypothetical protein
MAKRFTDTDKWKKNWFINLSKDGKLLWGYITDNCDFAGICDYSEKIFSMFLDFNASREKMNELLGNKIIWLSDDKFYIPSFNDFQYGELNPLNRVHKSVLDKLNKLGAIKPLISPLKGAKDKDKDKDKNKDKDKDLIVFDTFRKKYPGTKRGNETEFKNFQKHKDYKEVLSLLEKSIDIQIEERRKLTLQKQSNKNIFIPQWKNLQTWINKRSWEESAGASLITKNEPECFICGNVATIRHSDYWLCEKESCYTQLMEL